ncbi:fumarylacetoacetate hydrolase family protein [Gemmatimonas sp.]|jgi:2-keto-4-pentenoate hydratase/2-oxohepta-3-ene-1,7-dioic acid hydratase in catechol pathway|uniref:fumarylacetoacetate hydrolase family protein n=2 Tax=Gemmatimonas sp. TaxID=1962908 RepID=UPI0025C509B3|nr:fumarylacetoacetate hydrolase family protein [Gemmatimonas sp.]MCE2954499.1 fumarylacetoacetate hydrolase family protein [Gemmatimonas sp.]
MTMHRPSKIVCVGRNYLLHAKEMGNDLPAEPLLFLKPPSSIIREGEAIVLHPVSTHIEYEGEIAIVMGARLSRAASEAEAVAAMGGVVALNDVTARDLQKNDGQWARAKGLDTFCPIGEPVPAPADLDAIELVTRLNGVEVQRARGGDMAFRIPFLLHYISQYLTLEPGDVVATGTPHGVGRLSPGDVVEVELVGLSRVSNPVVAAS